MVSDIIFKNSDTGYTVFEIISDQDVYTVVGSIFDLNIGEKVNVYGEFYVHPLYGHQIKAQFIEKLLPENRDELFLYLSSGIIKGIGKKTAKKIIDAFGDDTIRILQEEPERLLEIKGMTASKIENIKKSFSFQKFLKEIMQIFSQYGLSQNYAMRLFKLYSFSALGLLKDNPYFLLEIFPELSFSKIDKMAIDMGFSYDNPKRIEAKVLNLLLLAANIEGHTNLRIEDVVQNTVSSLDVTSEIVINTLETMLFEKKVVKKFVDGDERLYLYAFYEYERYVAQKILKLTENRVENDEADAIISKFEEKNNIIFSNTQKSAIRTALNEGVCIITGGPGTGKTTIIKCIIQALEKEGKSILLCAPTGRAAKRMNEQSGKEAKTIHRLLEMTVQDGKVIFQKGQHNPIKCDVLIVDEMSMADIQIMYYLLQAVKNSTKLIMVGDVDQLPPVGAGNVLKDLIKSHAVKFSRLSQIFRQSENSLIIVNAHRINGGLMPMLSNKSDFFFIERKTQKEIVETICTLVCEKLPKYLNADPKEDIQVLCPSRKGIAGSVNLNKVLQDRLNPKKDKSKEVIFKENVFRIEDKVMQIRNNYSIEYIIIKGVEKGKSSTGIFNGDIGFINHINKEEGYLKITFDDREVEYDFTLLDDLELSYAMTVHKSQGSEFKCIVMPIYNTYPMLMTKNLLYTAVTRAKELVVLVGSKEALSYMVKNDRETMRYSGLCEFLTNSQ